MQNKKIAKYKKRMQKYKKIAKYKKEFKNIKKLQNIKKNAKKIISYYVERLLHWKNIKK